MQILTPTAVKTAKTKVQRFHQAVIPAQAIPRLGKVISAACPSGYGLIKLNEAFLFPSYGDRYALPLESREYLYIFTGEFKIREVVPSFDICGTPSLPGSTLGFVRGHELLDPLPSFNDQRWQGVKYIKPANKVPFFVNTVTGDVVLKADIVLLTRKPGMVRCEAHIIENIQSL